MKRTDSYKGLTRDMNATADPKPRTFGSFKKKREEQDRKPINTKQLLAIQRKRALLEMEEQKEKADNEAARLRKLEEIRGDKANVIEEASYEDSENSFK